MTLSEKIVEILAGELGPAAASLFSAQCAAQNKDPSKITKDDLDGLTKGIYEDIRPLVGDDLADRAVKKILALKQ